MKSNLRLLTIIASLSIIFSCRPTQHTVIPNTIVDNKEVSSSNEAYSIGASTFSIVEREYFGTIAKTTVLFDNVNIRISPSLTAEVINQAHKGDIIEIRGFSIQEDYIDGYSGHWVKVSLENRDDDYYSDSFGNFGWVFSKFIDIDSKIKVSTFRLLSINEKSDSTSFSLIIEIDRGGDKVEVEIFPDKLKTQSFYTFAWSDDIQEFMFNDPVGTFKWDPVNNEISHLTYMGSDSESAWCFVTNDYSYLMQDFGTSPGPRGLQIYNIKTNKLVFSGTYYHELDYDGESITIVEVYNEWNVEKSYIDKDSITRAESFISKTPMTEDNIKWKSQGGTVDVIVKYRLSLISFNRAYIGCNYINVQ